MPVTAMTNAQIKTETRILVGDPGATSWDDSMVQTAVNFAIQHYCRLTGVTYLEGSPATTSGEATIPTAFIEVRRVKHNGVWLLSSSYESETMRNPSWTSLTGTAKRWLRLDGSKVRVTPIPPSGNVTIGYTEEPSPLAADGDLPDARIPLTHHRALKYAAGGWLLRQDTDSQDFDLSEQHFKTFTELIQQQ